MTEKEIEAKEKKLEMLRKEYKKVEREFNILENKYPDHVIHQYDDETKKEIYRILNEKEHELDTLGTLIHEISEAIAAIHTYGHESFHKYSVQEQEGKYSVFNEEDFWRQERENAFNEYLKQNNSSRKR